MFKKPKGTKDISIKDGYKWNELTNILKDIAEKYNFKKIQTPTFESKGLFTTTVGEGTDVVSKELYEFKDKGDRELALRPEGTAGVVRSFIEDKLYVNETINKLWYLETMYRYERPQAGRQREFWSFGTEVFSEKSTLVDLEVISMANDIVETIGLKDVDLHINTLGDSETREKYIKIITEYFTKNKAELCPVSIDRLSKNPMRILDCKVCSQKDVVKNAPKIKDSMTDESIAYYEDLKAKLTKANIKFIEDPSLVRGLGYYSDIVFEFINKDEKQGAKSTIIGGGRYDGLVKTLGGPDISGVGFGLGMERLLLAMENEGYDFYKPIIDAFVINIAKDDSMALNALKMLRDAGYKTDYNFGKQAIKNGFKEAEKNNASFALIIGDDEVKNNEVTIKDQETKEEIKVKLDKLVDYFEEME